MLAYFSLPVFIGVALTANVFIPLILGPEWEGGVIFVQVFSVVSAFTILATGVAGSLLYSRGKPKLLFQVDSISNAAYFVGLLLLAQFGVAYVLIIRAVKGIVTALVKQVFALGSINRSIFTIFHIIWQPLLGIAIMSVLVIFLQHALAPIITNGFVLLAVLVIAGAGAYLATTWNLTWRTYADLRKTFG